ncbi:MAG: hypothetical protein IJE15_08415 [Bacteroidaceae bacterium]|nr:hypothetical protein [Bacteroidaceae bacterium]
MPTSNLHKLPPNQRLRVRLDDFYRLAEDALCLSHNKEGFASMSLFLCAELEDLCRLLSSLESQYKEELPLIKDEPLGVCWADEKMRMNSMTNMTVQCDEEQSGFSPLVTVLMEEASRTMESIEKELETEYSSQQFAGYGRRSLQDFNLTKWNPKRREIQAKISKISEAHQKSECLVLLGEYIERLKGISKLILSKDGEEIYYEALGRFIWHSVHDEAADEAKVDELLCIVKTIEHLCGRIERQLTFLDQELPADMKNDEEAEQETLKQKTLQNQCPTVTFRLKSLKKYLRNGFTEEWIEKMVLDMVHSEHSAFVCEKMKAGKLPKFVHQIAGVLKYQNVLNGCTYDEIVEALKFTKPQKQSRKDYVRHMINDNESLQNWLETYIAEQQTGH